MNLWQWILKHPQRLSGLMLTSFGSLQMTLVPFQAQLSPMKAAMVNVVFGLLMTTLAWAQKNLKDEP